MEQIEKKYMQRAISLARRGEGKTNPNPLVGAVIVKDGKIIGEGFHHKYGDLHAERDALKNCYEKNNNPAGSTIYVTLEPCCHFGKQPPCTQALVQAGVSHVVVASRDPNPLVHGKGNDYLREHGIKVTEDFLKEESDKLNNIFFKYIQENIPYVALKYAMTMDGKIACKTGESKWITNEKSRLYVQKLRNKYSGILCGIGTVLKDDPMLNCRIKNGTNPLRIICDSNLRIPLESKIVKTSKEIKTLIVGVESTEKSFLEKKELLESFGSEVFLTKPDKNKKVNFTELLNELGKRKIDSVLVEGGAEINYSLLSENLVDCVYAFVAPKSFGGNAKSPVSGEGVENPSKAFNFILKETKKIENDILLKYEKQNY